jgi:hypothetical protein
MNIGEAGPIFRKCSVETEINGYQNLKLVLASGRKRDFSFLCLTGRVLSFTNNSAFAI